MRSLGTFGAMRGLWLVTMLAVGCGAAVDHSWQPYERRWREGGIQVAQRAVRLEAEDIEALDRAPVFQLGTMIVRPSAELSANELERWVDERAAQLGGTHVITQPELQTIAAAEIDERDWLTPVTVEYSIQERGARYVVFQVRATGWPSLPTHLQPVRQR